MRTYTVIVVNPLEQCDKDDKPAGMLFQYDYGQRIVFGGVDLPEAYEVHFSNQKMGKSVTVIGDVTGVDIPDAMLLTGQDVHVWLYLHQGETDGETVYYARIAVRQRAKPTHETPTPVQQDEITQAIAALNAAVESTEADAAAAEASAEDAGRSQAAAEAAQDRAEAAQDRAEAAQGAAESAQTGAETAQDKAEDAQEAAEGARDRAETAAAFLEDCSAEAETLTAGSPATASYSEGVFHFGIPRGQKGSAGQDGKDGKDGKDGADGFSPSASVSKSGTTATISITDKDGTTTASISDGADGADGQDGYTPQRGTDYWTAEDQAVIISAVEDAVEPEISELKSEIDGKAPVILRDASGDIVTFVDGADGMPLSSCVVQIDPVQSGSGDPAPDNVRPISGWTGCNISQSGADTSDPTVYSISFPTAAGTVYGGTLTVHEDGTGTLTATWAAKTLDEFTSIETTTTGTGHYVTVWSSGIATSERNRIHPIGEAVNGVIFNSRGAAWTVCTSSSAGRMLLFVPSDATVEQVNSAVAGTKIIYPLATPTTYELTAEEVGQIIIQSGEQNIWADTGAISLTYPADTQTYVDSAISAATDPDGNVIQVTGSTPAITGESGKRYVCGTVDSISITPPQTGIIDVVFTSGTTPTVLIVPNTVRFPAWFNSASLDASTKYEINIMDGTDGAVMAWQT